MAKPNYQYEKRSKELAKKKKKEEKLRRKQETGHRGGDVDEFGNPVEPGQVDVAPQAPGQPEAAQPAPGQPAAEPQA